MSFLTSMKISNFEIRNFRNVLKANVTFSDINIFTGKNSSGKTNFLSALRHSLNPDLDFSETYFENVVTLGKGLKHAYFKVTVDNPGGIVTQKFATETSRRIIRINGKKMVFENLVSKKNLTPQTQKLYFTGEYKSVEGENLDYAKFVEDRANMEKLVDQLVYSAKTTNIEIENVPQDRLIDDAPFQDSSDFLKVFKYTRDRIWSFTDDVQTVSSSAILKYVTQRIDNPEEYELIAKRLKDHKPRFGDVNKSKYSYLVADIQKDKKRYAQFKDDLSVYTEGIIDDVRICPSGALKGQIVIEGPNTPMNIQHLSAGTAVLIFFITLKNWLQLDYRERTYITPSIMFFDEVDSIIHASMIPTFTDLLKSISKYVQLFISTHSPYFLDAFDKKNIFYLKDFSALPSENASSIENIYSYDEIIKKLPSKNKSLLTKPNSMLFVDGLIDAIFPVS